MNKSESRKTIKRSFGTTQTECYLSRLCDHSFLRLWSYPRIFRDQYIQGGCTIGKEVCDLLVVFDNQILIFSDKYCSFPNTGDLFLDWSRWARVSILESAKQIYGAERWIRNFPCRLFIDQTCKEPFPIKLPDIHSAKFHRILVAHGASERCKEYFGGSGSLIINTLIIGKDHVINSKNKPLPFSVGQIDLVNGYIHVFDDTSLDIAMTTLDTITDFVNYLEKKEKLIKRLKGGLVATGEEELIAYYLKDMNKENEHDFIVPTDIDLLSIEEGFWEKFIKSPERKSQIEANKISYGWDALIETFITHIMNGTQYYSDQSIDDSPDLVIRLMAKEPRTRRRMLIRAFYELIEKTPESFRGTRVIVPSKPGEPYYIFLLIPQIDGVKYDDYRDARGKLLEACCRVTKLVFTDAKDIVGIATETGECSARSEDALYFDARIWTPEMQKDALNLQNELGLLINLQEYSSIEYEYPASRKKKRKRHRRKK